VLVLYFAFFYFTLLKPNKKKEENKLYLTVTARKSVQSLQKLGFIATDSGFDLQ
jgi:preprotein translocase subunit YajC